MDYKELKKLADEKGITVKKNGRVDGNDLYQALIIKGVIPVHLSDEDYHNVEFGHFGFYTKNTDDHPTIPEYPALDESSFTTPQLIMESVKYIENLFEKTSGFEIESLVFSKDKEKTVTISLGENVFMLKGDSKIPSDWRIIYAGQKANQNGGVK